MSSRNPNTLMSVPDEQFDYLFKIVLIGDCGTGKTCIVQRLKSGNFIERHGNTIGVDFSMKTLIVDGKKVKVSAFNLICIVALHFWCNLIIILCIILASNMGYRWTRKIQNNYSELLSLGKWSYYRYAHIFYLCNNCTVYFYIILVIHAGSFQ